LAAAGEPLASGLALVDPPPGVAIAFNAAPGTVGPDEPGPYGAYATALTEMLAAGGLSLDDLFARVRLRVSEITSGGEVPWYASQIDGPFVFTERAADAPPAADVVSVADLRAKPMRSYSSVEDAYAAALALDTIEGYEQFLELYPSTRFSRRVAAMLAVRREQIIWRHCVFNNTPPAYWSYLRRYPDGPHSWDARRRLAMLHAAYDAPQDLVVFDFGVPPPPREELVFVDRPVVAFWGAELRTTAATTAAVPAAAATRVCRTAAATAAARALLFAGAASSGRPRFRQAAAHRGRPTAWRCADVRSCRLTHGFAAGFPRHAARYRQRGAEPSSGWRPASVCSASRHSGGKTSAAASATDCQRAGNGHSGKPTAAPGYSAGDGQANDATTGCVS